MRLEPVPAPTGVTPNVEIRFPIAEQVIPVAKARGYKVRLGVEGGADVQLVLDGYAGPRTRSTVVELGSLVPEGTEIAPGEHLLVAIGVTPEGLVHRPSQPSRGPVTAVHFWVGAKGNPAVGSLDPTIALCLPRGTLNGEVAADAAVIDFATLNTSDSHSVSVMLRGPDGRAEVRSAFSTRQPIAVLGLQSGDWDVQVELLDGGGAPLPFRHARARRTFVVNRDAPVGAGS